VLCTRMLHLNTTIQTEQVWQHLAADVRRYLERRVDPASVDDLVQEVFVRLHDRRAELRATDRVAPWVFRIARSVAVDHLRRRRSPAELPPDLSDDSGEDDDNLPERILGAWLRTMIDTLPEPYREAVRLVDLEGHSQREIAERLGLSYSGLKSRVQRGRAQLRAVLLRCCDVELDGRGRVIDWHRRGGDCC
jgi:RNA polymerase sigma-70 factor, ECF subfamily